MESTPLQTGWFQRPELGLLVFITLSACLPIASQPVLEELNGCASFDLTQGTCRQVTRTGLSVVGVPTLPRTAREPSV